jgi:RNA polymerase sigma-70 factor (ECF subfamily)|tara:strand:- start:2519 stop:3046 length:528 start_codon:yes stop_codon:yes gene_type:complete
MGKYRSAYTPQEIMDIMDEDPIYFEGIAASIIGKNHTDIPDILQDSRIDLWKKFTNSETRGDAKIKSYIGSVIVNRARHYRRKEIRKKEIINPYEEISDFIMDIPDTRNSLPLEKLQREEQREGLKACLERLVPIHREILFMRYFREMSYEEMAEVAGTKVGTVKSRLRRAKENI